MRHALTVMRPIPALCFIAVLCMLCGCSNIPSERAGTWFSQGEHWEVHLQPAAAVQAYREAIDRGERVAESEYKLGWFAEFLLQDPGTANARYTQALTDLSAGNAVRTLALWGRFRTAVILGANPVLLEDDMKALPDSRADEAGALATAVLLKSTWQQAESVFLARSLQLQMALAEQPPLPGRGQDAVRQFLSGTDSWENADRTRAALLLNPNGWTTELFPSMADVVRADTQARETIASTTGLPALTRYVVDLDGR